MRPGGPARSMGWGTCIGYYANLPALSTEPRIHAVHADMVARWNAATGAAAGTGTPGHPEPRMVQLTK
ncbi:hypothetical protein IPZ58_02190 [Streptomyces roseoverticillatus]|uniref:hypothetical protein n=1 Tax=Streptomyces roseoverticillatus TaxID=66429 RepID=UPI001F3EC1BE|nr:hypothetical protein [Streptomyces roseoverticillatus]MCF3100392.1 hypothetical protein [Streptomyces roseoverticillatus]